MIDRDENPQNASTSTGWRADIGPSHYKNTVCTCVSLCVCVCVVLQLRPPSPNSSLVDSMNPWPKGVLQVLKMNAGHQSGSCSSEHMVPLHLSAVKAGLNSASLSWFCCHVYSWTFSTFRLGSSCCCFFKRLHQSFFPMLHLVFVQSRLRIQRVKGERLCFSCRRAAEEDLHIHRSTHTKWSKGVELHLSHFEAWRDYFWVKNVKKTTKRANLTNTDHFQWFNHSRAALPVSAVTAQPIRVPFQTSASRWRTAGGRMREQQRKMEGDLSGRHTSASGKIGVKSREHTQRFRECNECVSLVRKKDVLYIRTLHLTPI